VGELAVAPQHDDFRGAGVPADPDLRVQPGGSLSAGVGEDDDPAGVFPAGLVRGLDRFFLQPGAGDDHEGQDPAQGDHTALLTQGHDLFGDPGGGGVR
jgi:hypothetical protein